MRTPSQRLLSMVLALSMLLTFLPVSAFAESTSSTGLQELNNDDTYTDPSNNDKYEYTLNPDDNTATLTKFTGTNADVPKTVMKGTETYKVTTIGEKAFANDTLHNNTTLNSVKLPDTIRIIGDHAFSSCNVITSIIIPKDVVSIGMGAFTECIKLSEVTLRDCNSLKSIGDSAFSHCTDLTSITLPENLSHIGTNAFVAAGLTDVTLPKSLNSVGLAAFFSYPKAIQTVTYTGTEEDWDKLVHSAEFGAHNTQLTDVTPHCAHTVTFNKNGHGASEEKLVQYDEKAEKPSDPKADGFTFKGWYTASEGGEKFNFGTGITEDTKLFAHWEKDEKPTEPNPPQNPDDNKTDTDKPNKPNEPATPEQPGTPDKPNEPTPPEVPAVEEDDTAAIGYAAAAVTAAFVGWGAYRIGSEVYLKYLLPKDVLLPQNRIQLAELLWEDAGRPAPADAAAYTDVDANDADAQQAARWAVENGLLTLPDTEKPEEFAPYRSVSYAKSARAWNKAQQLKENAAAR